MVKVCCVPYCRSRNTSDNNILFHPFPLSKVLRKQWSLVVQQHARKSPRHPLVIKEHTTVCSKHFSKTDYWKAGNVLKLRKNAVPTIFNLQENENNISSKQKSEPNQDTVLKKNKLKQPFQNTTKPVLTVKIRPKQLRYVDKKKAKDSKEVKNIEDPQNWRNLLFITKDHAYAALWQNESIDNNKKDNSSEDDTDNDELKDVPYATNVVKDTINLDMLVHEAEVQCATTISEKLINTDILLQELDVPCATNVSEDTTIPDMVLHKPDLPCTTDATDMLAQEAMVLSPNETVVEEAAPMSSNESNTEICRDTETQNKMQLVNTDTHQLTESVFLKEEIIEECPLNNEEISICKSDYSIQKSNSVNETIDSQKVTTVATNEQNKNVVNTNTNTNTLPAKLSKRVNTISKKNLPEICILCATSNMTTKNYTLIVHFAAIIMDLSGVDILKSNVAPIACNVCFKNLLEMWNFKQQIVAADKFISENIPKQPPIHINSRNLPKPPGTTFEYIDCDKQNINNTLIDTKNQRQPEIVDLSEVTLSKQSSINQNKLISVVAAIPKSKSDLPNKDNGITLVPIEDILKDNNINGANDDHYNDRDSAESSEDFSDLPTCTDCGLTLENINTKNCDCKKMCLQKKVGKNNTQQEKFVCSTCGKQYPFLRSLKRHEVTHKQKQCLCTVCGQVFHFHLYLKRHMRKHSGKKPFACPYCNKKFSSQWNLSQHKRLHTNSLPYECKLCPTAFRHNVTLKKHVRMFHTADQMFRNSQHTGTPSAISNGNN